MASELQAGTEAGGVGGTSARVMVVDDMDSHRRGLVQALRRAGYSPLEASSGPQALAHFQEHNPDAVLLDVRLPGLDGLEVLREIRRRNDTVPVIMMTGYADVNSAIRSIRLGAQDYLTKPLNYDEVRIVLRKVLRVDEAGEGAARVKEGAKDLAAIMGPGPRVAEISALVDRVAGTDFTVIVIGESGSGKEVVARAIHARSPRERMPFVALDCGAIAETLAESELFGHERGAFTSADRQRIGCFEQAGAGTLFLDELANLSQATQARLLRVLQERQFRRVGGQEGIALRARIIVSTVRPLSELAASGEFRQDLYYRMNEFSIQVPALRERREDVLYLAKRFVKMTSGELGRKTPEISEEASKALAGYEWPGNVRELRNVCRRAALMAHEEVRREHLNIPTGEDGGTPEARVTLDGTRGMGEILEELNREAEVKLIGQAMGMARGNKAEASRLLHINYKTLYLKLKRYGIS